MLGVYDKNLSYWILAPNRGDVRRTEGFTFNRETPSVRLRRTLCLRRDFPYQGLVYAHKFAKYCQGKSFNRKFI
jgi:hypothetical protein